MGEKGPHPLQGSLAVLPRQVKPWWEERVGPTPFLGLICLRALPETLKGDDGVPFSPINAATISDFCFGIL
jgi:hypothetical protein